MQFGGDSIQGGQAQIREHRHLVDVINSGQLSSLVGMFIKAVPSQKEVEEVWIGRINGLFNDTIMDESKLVYAILMAYTSKVSTFATYNIIIIFFNFDRNLILHIFEVFNNTRN